MAQTSIINSANDYYLRDLLNPDSLLKYVIPKYQREYSWRKPQWAALYDDIMGESGSKPHFLGTVIAISGDDAIHPQLELVDGQQRMTSLSILLAALYREMADGREQFIADESRLFESISLRKMLATNDNPRLRLQAQGNNNADYVYLVSLAISQNGQAPTPVPRYWGNRGIGKAYKYFRSRITSELEGSTDPLSVVFGMARRVRNTVLVKIEVPDHASAFTLFESLNNRGMDLSPIDLIKNEMLARADSDRNLNIDNTYEKWMRVIAAVGPDGGAQERFLRYYYNAFKSTVGTPATHSNLIRLYENWLDEKGVDVLLDELAESGRVYGMLAGSTDDCGLPAFKKISDSLRHAGGAQGFMPLMWFTANRERLQLSDKDLAHITMMLAIWFVRRNFTDYPATNTVQRLFVAILRNLEEDEPRTADQVIQYLQEQLTKPTNYASDTRFEESLRGPVYEDNRDMTRYVLAAIAQTGMTGETWVDLWRMNERGTQYYFTIEHIFPKTENITQEWIDAFGSKEQAEEVRSTLVHTLGNLTLTGYNSDLGRMGFERKRDRKDSAGRYIGYRNGLNLNDDVVDKTKWDAGAIKARTDRLVSVALKLLRLQ